MELLSQYPSRMEVIHGLNNLAALSPRLTWLSPHSWVPNMSTTWSQCWVPHMALFSTLWACYLVAGWLHWNSPILKVSTLSSRTRFFSLDPNVLYLLFLKEYFLFTSFSTHSLISTQWEFSIMLRWSRKKCVWLPLVEKGSSLLKIKLKINALQLCMFMSVYSHYLSS